MDDWQKLQELFHLALELPEIERPAFVMQHAGYSEDIRQQVLSLIDSELKSATQTGGIKHEIAGLLQDNQSPQISGYEVLEQIGSGGMGTVYRAIDNQLSRDVAIKLLHPHRSQQEKSKQRFFREARATAKIRHDNICPVYEISETTEGALYIASAFCEGESLTNRIVRNSITLDQIFSIIKQLASALSTAHAQNVIHRDLKPENIIVDDDFRIQLVDFGIAKIRDDHQSTTGEIIGTPSYMSPEQFRGEAIDAATDIWAFGILLYEMIEGVTPFNNKTAPEIVYAMLHEPIHFTQEDSEAFNELISIVRQCLQIDKNLRPANAESLQLLIEKAHQSLLDSGSPESKPVYVNKRDEGNHDSQVSLSSERRIIVLSMVLTDNQAGLVDWARLMAMSKKYRGLLQPKPNPDNSGLLLIETWFGYPLADEMAVMNCLLCGVEWQKELSTYSIKCNLIAGYEILTEIDNVTSGSTALSPNVRLRRHNIHQRIDSEGIWMLSQFARAAGRGSITLKQSIDIEIDGQQVECYQLENDSISESAQLYWSLSPMVGRQPQLNLMLDGWQQTLEGDPQNILISGEAGIGKSRLIQEFIIAARKNDSTLLIEIECSPYEQASTYYPILNYLRQRYFPEILILPDDAAKSQVAKFLIEDIHTCQLGHQDTPAGRVMDELMLARLLGISLSEHELASLPTGDLLNREYQSLLSRILNACPEGQIALIIIEDLHWSDAGTDAIIERLLRQSDGQSRMVIMSCRPEYSPVWLSQLLTNNLYLSKLRQSQSHAMMLNLLDGEKAINASTARIDPDYVASLCERTGGNPLFIEELAKSIGQDSRKDTGTTLAIPDTLQDTLIARLERLGVALDMAHVAAVIGRDFSIDLLNQCYRQPDREFDQQLNTLTQSGIVQPLNDQRQGQYRFKHALIRDAAYQMLLPESRRQLHQHIAGVIEQQFQPTANNQPELLAQHYEAAKEWNPAINYWIQAAQRNLQLSSITECLQQCRHGLELIENIATEADAKPLSLALYMCQGPALMARYGYADEQVKDAYTQVLELSEALNNPISIFNALFGLWTYHCVRAQHTSAFKLSERMVVISEQTEDPDHSCVAYSSHGMTAYYMGKFCDAQSYFDNADLNYQTDHAEKNILLFGQDMRVVIYSYQAWTEAMLGNFECATQHSENAIGYARELEHPFSLVYALSFATWSSINAGQLDIAESLADEALNICNEYEITVFKGLVMSLASIIYLGQQKTDKGLTTMAEASEIYLSTGAQLFLPSFQAARAEVEIASGNLDNAETLLNQAIAMMDQSQENWSRAPALGLLAIVHQGKNEREQVAELLTRCKQVLKEQDAHGLSVLLKQKGLPI